MDIIKSEKQDFIFLQETHLSKLEGKKVLKKSGFQNAYSSWNSKRTKRASGSIANVKSNGESWHSCLDELPREK